MKILFLYVGNTNTYTRPIGLSTLIAILKHRGHTVDLFDSTFLDIGREYHQEAGEATLQFKKIDWERYGIRREKANLAQKLRDKIDCFRPQLIAASVMSDMFPLTIELLNEIRDLKIPTVVGGVHVTVDPDSVIAEEAVDYICVGEGDEALPELVEKLENGHDIYDIKNIWFKQDGRIIKNPVREPIRLHDLPFLDWDLFDERYSYKPYLGKVYRGGDVMLTRGCPYKCTFCVNPLYHEIYPRHVRSMSVDRFITEMQYLKGKYGLNFIKIFDESFLAKPIGYLEELATKYAAQVNIPFTCMANANTVTQEKARLLRRMNCVSVSLGVESGNYQYRKQILKKDVKDSEIIRAVKLLHENGIRVVSFNMIGLPFETKEMIFETIHLNRKAKFDLADVGFFFPYKGTHLRKVCIESGILDERKVEKATYSLTSPVIDSPQISTHQLIGIRKAFQLFMLAPKWLYPIIKFSIFDNKFSQLLFKILSKYYYYKLHYWRHLLNRRGIPKGVKAEESLK